MSTNRPVPVLMIALDAAEPRLIEQWMNDGTLPNLKRLRAKGCYGRLASTADWLAGSPWPTFYTGTTPAEHGLYHTRQWRADQMRHFPVSPDWLPLHPFWRDLSETGHRVVAVDIPMTYPLEPFNGVEIYGWAAHDRLVRKCTPTAYPPSAMDLVRRELGLEATPLGDEPYGVRHTNALLQMRDQIIRATCQVADLAKALMRRETWDLFMVAFAATHRGGHKLWDLSGVWGDTRPGDLAEFSHALRDVYVACDKAVGQLTKTAGDGVTMLVFSLHGMGPNRNRVCLLPTMLAPILGKEAKYSILQRLKEYIPIESRLMVSRSLPLSLLYKFYSYWRVGSIDWTATPAISLVADLQGYIRINLRGREAAGIVEPGEEYDRLCTAIAEGLSTFVDADTGKPVVESVIRTDQLFKQGRRLNNLPDLIVRWASSPAANHREIVSARYGSIPWPLPKRHPTGRSGNHRPEGFLLAVGGGIQPDSRIENAHILDLAPTVCALLNAPRPTEMCGKVLSAIQPG